VPFFVGQRQKMTLHKEFRRHFLRYHRAVQRQAVTPGDSQSRSKC
jgi:hypothetical protein